MLGNLGKNFAEPPIQFIINNTKITEKLKLWLAAGKSFLQKKKKANKKINSEYTFMF